MVDPLSTHNSYYIHQDKKTVKLRKEIEFNLDRKSILEREKTDAYSLLFACWFFKWITPLLSLTNGMFTIPGPVGPFSASKELCW